MTVREFTENRNNESLKVYRRSTKMYVNPQDVWDEKVLSMRMHKECKQTDVVLQVR